MNISPTRKSAQPMTLAPFDRMFNSMAQQNKLLLQQLSILNHNILMMMENSHLHFNGIRNSMSIFSTRLLDVSEEMLRKQGKIVDLGTEILQGTKMTVEEQVKHSEIQEQQETDMQQKDGKEELKVQENSEAVKFGEQSMAVTKLQSTITSQRNSQRTSQQLQLQLVNTQKAPNIKFPPCLTVFQFEQKQVVVQINKFIANQPNLSLSTAQTQMTSWLASLYNRLATQAFSAYYSRYLSEDQTKIHYTRNLSINFSLMSEYFFKQHKDLWLASSQQLISHFQQQSSRVLSYMMIKYPQKQKAYVSDQIRNAIQPMDRSDELRFDYLSNTQFSFEYDETRKTYQRKIKGFMNRIIEESQSHVKEWRGLMRDMFTIDGKELKNLVGMKFKENTPKFSQKEIEEDGIRIKTPELLRVVIKWIEELEKKVKGLSDGRLIHDTFNTKGKENQPREPEYLNKFMKQFLNEFMVEKQPEYQQAYKQMRVRIRSMLSLMPQFLQKYMQHFGYINPNQVKSGLLCWSLSQTASNLSTNYLLFLIHFLQSAAKHAKKQYDGLTLMDNRDSSGNDFKEQVKFFTPEFITFRISDLLRCKCVGTLEEIKKVYEKLSSHEKFTVYRVKNRIDTSNKDFLVNCRLNGTPVLCEVQLAIFDKSPDEKQEYLNHFSHFMYELSRASYGPIAQAVMINSHLTEFAPFFKQCIQRIPQHFTPSNLNISCTPTGCLSMPGYIQRNNDFSFICSHCLTFKLANTSHLTNFDSSFSVLAQDQDQNMRETKGGKRMICGDCVYGNLDRERKSQYMLKRPLSYFFEALDKKDSIPQLVCAVEKHNCERKVRILQRCTQPNGVEYVPVFYTIHKKNSKGDGHIRIKVLKENYYLFQPKQTIQYVNTDPVQTVYAFTCGLKNFHPSNTPLTLPSEMSSKQVVFANDMTPDSLSNYQNQLVQLLHEPTAPCLLLINDVLTEDQLQKLTRKGRQLKQGQAAMLRKSKIWRLDKSNLDNHSLSIFSEDSLPVQQIMLLYNNCTDMHFLRGQFLRKLDLTENSLTKLKLQQGDFPMLEHLDVTFNRLDTIEKLEHSNLRTLLISVNRLKELREAEWRLPRLQHLEVINNQLVGVDMRVFNGIKVLHLDDNKLEEFKLPKQMNNLQLLNISRNPHIKTLDFSQTLLPCLQQLDVSDCSLSTIHLPCSLPCLQNLLFNNNHLQQFLMPTHLPSLLLLSFYNNKLTSIDFSRTHMPKLPFVNLNMNRLEEVRFGEGMQALEEVEMWRNCLRRVDFRGLKKLKLVDIGFNYVEEVMFEELMEDLEQFKAGNNLVAQSLLPTPNSPQFPHLSTIQSHLQPSICTTVLWLLWRMPKPQFLQVLTYTSSNSHFCSHPIPPQRFEQIFPYSWTEQDLSDQVREDCKAVMEAMLELRLVPQVIVERVEGMREERGQWAKERWVKGGGEEEKGEKGEQGEGKNEDQQEQTGNNQQNMQQEKQKH